MRKFIVWALPLAVLFAGPGFAQSGLDQFEDANVEIQEIGPGESLSPSGSAQAPPPTAGAGKPLAPVNLKPAPAAAAAPAPRPPVNAPTSPQPSAEAQSRTGVRTQVALPAQGVSLDADFQDQIRALNQQIGVLKERVIEAKSRLLSYSQKVAQGFASGTQLFMKVTNRLGGDFQVERLVFYLDGHQIFTREFETEEEINELLAYKGSVLPGRHRIDVDAILLGDDGVFDFGHSARLRLESGEYFAANEGKVVELNLVLFDRGGAFKAIETRPGLKFEIVERDVF